MPEELDQSLPEVHDPEGPVANQFAFSEEEQIRILALLKYDEHLDLGLLRPGYFADPIHEQVAHVLLEYRKEYRQLPTQSVIESLLVERFTPQDPSLEYPDRLLAYALETVAQLDSLDLSEIPYYRNRATEFARTQRIEIALLRKSEYIREGRHEDFARLITTAVAVGANADVPVVDVFDAQAWMQLAQDSSQVRIPYPFPTLNVYMNGGGGGGELATIVAPPSGGKTRMLLAIAKTAMESGRTPLVMSVELAAWKLCMRLAQTFLGEARDVILADPDRTREALANYQAAVGGSTIHLMKFLPGVHGMSHIRTEYKRYKDVYGKPPMLIIDYADKIAPEKGVDKRIALENIYMDLFSLAGEEDIHVVTATQTNREGAGRETIQMTDIAECFAKAAISDYIFTLARAEDDASLTRLFVAKNRDGEALKNINIRVNLTTQTMSEC